MLANEDLTRESDDVKRSANIFGEFPGQYLHYNLNLNVSQSLCIEVSVPPVIKGRALGSWLDCEGSGTI